MTYDQLNELKHLDYYIKYMNESLYDLANVEDLIQRCSRKDQDRLRSKKEKVIRSISALIRKAEAEKAEVIDWIDGIPDPFISELVRLHCRQGFSFAQLEGRFPGSSAEAMRSMYYRFLKSQGIKENQK